MKLSESDSILFRFDLRVEAPRLVICENTPGTHRHESNGALISRVPCDFILIILQRLGAADSVETPCLLLKSPPVLCFFLYCVDYDGDARTTVVDPTFASIRARPPLTFVKTRWGLAALR